MSTIHPTVGTMLTMRQIAIAQSKGIVILCIDVFPVSRQGYRTRYLLFIAHIRTHVAEGTEPQLTGQVGQPVIPVLRQGLDRQHGSRAHITGWDKKVFLVADDQGERRYLVERVLLSQIITK